MENFIFQNPVKLIMGKGMIARLAKEIPSDKRIMITFGGGSVKKNGVYDQVKEALKNHFTVEFWGIEPNPAIETLRKAIALGKEEKVDYLLAVGGGSVIDGTKLISAGILYDGDAWDLVLAGRPVTHTVPLARNDLSRNCHDVRVLFYKEPQYYSHVIHLVSRVSGMLNEGADKIKTFIDTFPAGTLSGAPKVRAMQLISEIEPHNRGAYGGCIGFIGLNGELNQAITIRTFVSRNNELWFTNYLLLFIKR